MIKRTISGVIYVALIVLGIYASQILHHELGGYLAYSALIFFVAMVGTWEVYHNFELRGQTVDKGAGLVLAALSYLGTVAANILHLQLVGIPLLLALWLVVPLRQLWRQDADPFSAIGRTLLPLLWVVLPLLTTHPLGNHSVGLLMMAFICTWANDTGAYLCGMAFGRHKLWERHSPKKTWEGTLGGAVVCLAAAIFVGPLLVDGLAWWYWALVGLVCTVMGTLGDLTESMFKRACGVKDSGRIMPGHGGILDRFDSMLFIAPTLMALVALGLIF